MWVRFLIKIKVFIASWVRLLYTDPLIRIRVNGIISDPFPIARGTRQGCPLSPLLFALAIEPLVVQLRSSSQLTGLRIGEFEERVSLYADDMLLYLQDPGPSLLEAFRLIQKFGDYSGFRINWKKSSLFSIDEGVDVPLGSPIPLSTSFRYLGIEIQLPISKFLEANLSPIVGKFREKVQRWQNLPITLMGRINLFKMIFLPKFLYILSNSPVFVTLQVFCRFLVGIQSSQGLFNDLETTSYVGRARPSGFALLFFGTALFFALAAVSTDTQCHYLVGGRNCHFTGDPSECVI